jgi:hypothetical protein
VLARKVATKHSVHQQLAAQDRIVGSGRRILMQLGLGSVSTMFVADTDPDSDPAADPDYPDEDTFYVVARADQVPVTPGSMIAFELLALPSGPTQKKIDVNNWDPDGAGGYVRVAVTFTNAAAQTVTMTRTVSIPASQLQFNAKPSTGGKGWEVVKRFGALAVPDDFDDIPATTAKWSGPYMLATITISHQKSPRVIDLVVYETPRKITRDISTGNWPAHLYTQNAQPYGAYPHIFPVEQSSSTDKALGMEHAIATANETGWQLGPAIFHWSSWQQETATIDTTFSSSSHGGDHSSGTGDDEAPPATYTNTSYAHWLDTTITAYDAANPGFSMGCGAYGRHYRSSDTELILPNNGVVEVIVGVYCKLNDAADTGTFRFQVSPYSYVDVEIPTSSTSDAWFFAAALLECGTGPEDDKNCQIFVKGTGAPPTLSLRNLAMYYRSDA